VVVLGLTGSVAMGKSTAAAIFRSFGVPVCDADAMVHRLLGPGGAAVAPVEAVFPGTRTEGNGIDRRSLAERVFGRPDQLARLEAILHPLVRHAEARFLARCCAGGARLAVLDIPLLFETGGERLVDAVVVVSAPEVVQMQRALRRPGMTPGRLAAIRARQLPDREKRRRADFIVPTGLGRRRSIEAIAVILGRLRQRGGRAWPRSWSR
jgi:dephospho-CoA kinase